MRTLAITAAATFVLDQVTKVVVVHLMGLATRGYIEVLPPWLSFRMAWNRGINFGLFANDTEVMRWGLVAISLAISAWVVWWVASEARGRFTRIAGGLLVGGALGNAVDRVIYGAVADFLNMTCCGFENPSAFNVADIAIFAGAVGLILLPGGADPVTAGAGRDNRGRGRSRGGRR